MQHCSQAARLVCMHACACCSSRCAQLGFATQPNNITARLLLSSAVFWAVIRLPYVQVAAKQMVGVYLSVWVRRGILQHVRGVQVTYVGTGMMGYLGNKGQSRCCPYGRAWDGSLASA